MKITLPADVRFFRPVRLAVGGLGALVGFDVEAMEDLRIGVDELCGACYEGGDGSDIEVTITIGIGERIHVACECPVGPTGGDPDRFVFSERILSVVADAHGIEAGGGMLRSWLERSLADHRVVAEAR